MPQAGVRVDIKTLSERLWSDIKRRCSGGIGSLLELLEGKLSDNVMAVVTDRQRGLFPQPGEIDLTCSCPDWADMCKHVAATLYGIGARLDDQPELLFLLRGVHHEEPIGAGEGPAHPQGAGALKLQQRTQAAWARASTLSKEQALAELDRAT